MYSGRKLSIISNITAKTGDIMNKKGKLIRCHRKKSGLTQKEVADLAGVGKSVVFDVEHGKSTVQFDSLRKICDVLNITITLNSPIMEQCLKEVDHENS